MASKTQTSESEQIVKVTCRECGRDTNHVVLKEVDVSGSEAVSQGITFQWWQTHQIMKCLGCDTFSFRSVTHTSEDDIEPDGTRSGQQEIYPNPNARMALEDIELVPHPLAAVYKETMLALNGKQPVLAAIGIRSIIETVCKHKKANGSHLFAKINSLVGLGVLAQQEADVLHKL